MRRFVVLVAVLATACAPALPLTVVTRGTPVTDGGLTMTVVDAGFVPRLSEEYYRGRWFVVDLDIASGDDIAWFNAMNQQLFIDGDEYVPDASAAELASAETDSGASLLPRSTATVSLAFSVAEYSTDSTIELVVRGDVDSPGVVVSLPGAVLQ